MLQSLNAAAGGLAGLWLYAMGVGVGVAALVALLCRLDWVQAALLAVLALVGTTIAVGLTHTVAPQASPGATLAAAAAGAGVAVLLPLLRRWRDR